ncbi:MAG: carboxypeptidase-like regulatory domain-containing protein, partial [Gemmatimonadota bacterium]|nr:carboxypeptidase-like regulatory domain-containing protein [Gemmatimonadota bacterium]
MIAAPLRGLFFAGLYVWLHVAPSAMAGQVVRGTGRELGSERPLAGVIVTLVPAREVPRAALTDETGRFAITAPGPGNYWVETKRIGVRRSASASFALAAGETRELTIRVDALPAVQSPIVISERQRCTAIPSEREDTAELWENARAALVASQLSEAGHRFGVSMVRYTRDLDPRTLAVRSDTRYPAVGWTTNPFKSASAEELSAHGYVVDGPQGTMLYRAPDAQVLLSPAFVRDHCFQAVRGARETAGLIGIAFEPAADRKLPDIHGVLWLNEATGELHHVDFSYTNLRNLNDVEGHQHLGGQVMFARLASGAWFVRRWWLRLPILVRVDEYLGVSRSTDRVPRQRLVLDAIREDGGEVAVTSVPKYPTPPRATITGTVVDSGNGSPASGARIALGGTAFQSVVASDGRYELDSVPVGVYVLTVRH